MAKKTVVCICFLHFFVVRVSAQNTLQYGSEFSKRTFANIANNQKVTLPLKAKPALLFFDYTNNYNANEVPFLEVLEEGYGEDLDIFRVIAVENQVNQKDVLRTVKSLKEDTFNFDLYTQKTLLFVNKSGVIKYMGHMHSAHNFSMVLEGQGFHFKKPQPKSLTDLLKHTLLIDDAPEFSNSKKKLVILLRSICLRCGTDKQITDIMGSLKHANIDVDIIIIFRNEQVQQQFETLELNTETVNMIDQFYTSSPTKRGARLFAKGNPLLLNFTMDNRFINYRIADDLSGLALYRYLTKTLH